MQIAVWDTYVTKKDGSIMHFDVIVPSNIVDSEVIYKYGNDFLKSKNVDNQPLSSNQCRFCHIESARPEWETSIINKGYYIIEMENCN